MSTPYIQFLFTLKPVQPAREILVAELAHVGFESFVELDDGLEAYIPKMDWKNDLLDDISFIKKSEYDIQYCQQTIAPKNWNEVWESDFKPIIIDNRCAVRATFHEPIATPYELIITPKMSFGTGHHQTTYMLLQHLLDIDLEGASVLDMGCGTGVLAVLSEKKGGAPIDAIDIEPWCYENTKENALLNNCKSIRAYQGDSSLLVDKKYDVIIANINKNVLIKDISVYSLSLNIGGTLLLSGFYTSDLEDIENSCERVQLEYVSHLKKQNWVAAKFSKI
tara:strand:+ start:3686 stop:4522 length:837 start_codon:yes stop_codon:yes gene_type:complete